MKLVLDTGVLLLILKGSSSVSDVVKRLREGAEAVTAATNMAELYYKVEEKLGREVATTWLNRLLMLENLEVAPVDTELALKAGSLKAKYRRKISLADALIVALAIKLKSRLLTTDTRLTEIKEVKTKLYK